MLERYSAIYSKFVIKQAGLNTDGTRCGRSICGGCSLIHANQQTAVLMVLDVGVMAMSSPVIFRLYAILRVLSPLLRLSFTIAWDQSAYLPLFRNFVSGNRTPVNQRLPPLAYQALVVRTRTDTPCCLRVRQHDAKQRLRALAYQALLVRTRKDRSVRTRYCMFFHQ